MKAETPLQTHNRVKKDHPGSLLLIRNGDFYELFKDDARRAAKVLGLTMMTQKWRGAETPMAGFPYHTLESYLTKLVRVGFRVAICEPVDDGGPTTEDGIMPRLPNTESEWD